MDLGFARFERWAETPGPLYPDFRVLVARLAASQAASPTAAAHSELTAQAPSVGAVEGRVRLFADPRRVGSHAPRGSFDPRTATLVTPRQPR